jgi:hypothetical protein
MSDNCKIPTNMCNYKTVTIPIEARADLPKEMRPAELQIVPKNNTLSFTTKVVGKLFDRAFDIFVTEDRLPPKYKKLMQWISVGSFVWGFARDVKEQYALLQEAQEAKETPLTRLYFQKTDVFYKLVRLWIKEHCPQSFIESDRSYNIYTGIEVGKGENYPCIALTEQEEEEFLYPFNHLSLEECVIPKEERSFQWNGIKVTFDPNYNPPQAESDQLDMKALEGLKNLDPRIIDSMVAANYSEPLAELVVETENIEIIKQMFDEIKRTEKAEPRAQLEHQPYVKKFISKYNEWHSDARIPMNRSVFLPTDIEEALIQDVKEFIDRKEWYEELGLPHKRGYMFYGLPGTGKTSTIMAFAQQTRCDVYPIDLNKFNGDQLKEVISEAEAGIIVFEDIDCMFDGRSIRDAAGGAKEAINRNLPTFSQFLNILDGIGQRNGQIIIMTTNKSLDDFDDALIRPGRIDVKVHFTYATDDQIQRLADRFFKDNKEEIPRILKEINNMKPLTMCQVQEIFIRETFGGKSKKIG